MGGKGMQSPPCYCSSREFRTPPHKDFMLPPPTSGGVQKRPRHEQCHSPRSPSATYDTLLTPDQQDEEQGEEEVIDTDQLFREAELCREEERNIFSHLDKFWERGREDDCDGDDDFAPRKDIPVMVTLPCGDIHVCGRGYPCKYLVPNDDRILVCMYTGVEHAPEQTSEFYDLSGGSGKRCGDPDQNCGEPMYGKWTRRVDPVAASHAAYRAAQDFDDCDDVNMGAFAALLNPEAVKKTTKRGALCVGEAPLPPSTRRGRFSKRNVTDHATCINLNSEAENVISKLINYDRTSAYKRKSEREKVERKKPPPDPRMCDEKFVFNASVKKYIRSCMATQLAPSLDAIHNISLMAQKISKTAREEAVSDKGKSIRTAKFRTLCSGLIVAMWSACCNTPYMKNAKRGTDAYRPFICGCIYGFKRSIQLPDGSVLIPKCHQLAAALPVLRGTGGNAVAKTLHSSSHRGLCTISRCIASVPAEDRGAIFGGVIRSAAHFSSQTFSSNDI